MLLNVQGLHYGDCVHSLQWRHNERDGVLNHQPHDCLLNRLFRRRSKKTSKLRVTGLWAGNSPGGRWIPRTKGQWRGICFHLMTSSGNKWVNSGEFHCSLCQTNIRLFVVIWRPFRDIWQQDAGQIIFNFHRHRFQVFFVNILKPQTRYALENAKCYVRRRNILSPCTSSSCVNT